MTQNEEFETIKEFAETNRDMFPDGRNVLFYRSKKYKYFSDEHLNKLKDKFINSRNFGNNDVSTIPDNAVYFYIKKKFNKNDEEIEIIKEHHNMSMGVEDLIGHRLEEYIYSEAGINNWIWCSGNVLRSIDFIKKETNGDVINWKMLQVKNSDNSENSSSKKIRKGTKITHWFRRYSKRNMHNWEKLHKILEIETLTEENFIKFLEEKI
tara:strand:- start:519 stop:1145 length:627 start_codon:yes stop_codon:yes gene_type:complete